MPKTYSNSYNVDMTLDYLDATCLGPKLQHEFRSNNKLIEQQAFESKSTSKDASYHEPTTPRAYDDCEKPLSSTTAFAAVCTQRAFDNNYCVSILSSCCIRSCVFGHHERRCSNIHTSHSLFIYCRVIIMFTVTAFRCSSSNRHAFSRGHADRNR